MGAEAARLDEETLAILRTLGEHFPSAVAVRAEIARLSAALTLPKGIVHVVSDVHGEFKKLRHIVNNASGSLRALVERTFAARLTAPEKTELLTLLYYPREAWAHMAPRFVDDGARREFLRRTVRLALDLLGALARTRSAQAASAVFESPHRELLHELMLGVLQERPEAYLDALLEPFVREEGTLDLLRSVAHAVRNLAVSEIVVAGDLGDRGPRVDKVIEYLMRQPRVSFTWGNHDASWIGACLGHRALIATVLRISLRYRRLGQLEEGYAITMAPVEKLARTVYADDPAERFACKGEGLRDPTLMARMQKAMAILQLKLEGQIVRRTPAWGMQHRALLGAIDHASGTVTIDGVKHALLDARLPTVDPSDPYALTPEEEACIERLRRSFLESATLWKHVEFVVRSGAMALSRDDTLIFHGCVPVDAGGRFLSMRIGDAELAGRALFDALEAAMRRALSSRAEASLDLLWYLWTGPLSPLFGKDKMATFEGYFVADKAASKETKNPYFTLIHDADFCRRICREFGVDPERGLIVNGHVPVHVEKGELPLKRSGRAITIDGAFSEAYGDRGYTLVLEPERTTLAEHHHFESVEDAVAHGADIVPRTQDIRVEDRPRTIGDTEEGRAIRARIALLERLLDAYRRMLLPERVVT